MFEEKLDVVIASDPHGVTHGVGGWMTDSGTGRAALGVFGGNITVAEVARDAEFVAARVQGGTYVFSCYVSPRPPVAHFQSFLQRLENCVRGLEIGAKIIVAGDFNARSGAWGDWFTCARGNELIAFADSLSLVVINEGSEPTYFGKGAGSIVDVTLASESLSRNVSGWRVDLETDNGSDHHSIGYQITRVLEDPVVECKGRGWDTSGGIDLDLFQAGLIIAGWATQGATNDRDPNLAVKKFERVVSMAADLAVPVKKAPGGHRTPVYWWTKEIGELRSACNYRKRELKRTEARRRGCSSDVPPQELEAFRDARRALRTAIKRSKGKCWDQLLTTVDKDPWGKPYKLVLQKLGGPPPTLRMEKESVEHIVNGLFPRQNTGVGAPVEVMEPYVPLTMAELNIGVERIKSKNKAPGPDAINSAILVALHTIRPGWMLDLFNCCLDTGVYPESWKRGRLVLLRKGTKPVGEPSSYRPICLLNDVGKLFEFLLVRRVEAHLEERGSLSDNQYGFRRGMSTIDAASVLRKKAISAVNRYDMCVAISLDIRNAFNSIGWTHIMDAMRKWEVPLCLIRLFQSYFHDRTVEVVCTGAVNGILQVAVTCGVPQGSVVGPLLWNMAYDQVLRVEFQANVSLIGFADDTLVVASGRTSEEVEESANNALSVVAGKIRELGLSLAIEKSEAVMFRRKYKDRVPRISIDGVEIRVGRSIKYLGLVVDDYLNFKEHVSVAVGKAERVLSALSRIMPNIGGPKEPRRKLLVSVVHSVLLYGCPVWGHTLAYAGRSVDALARVQRRAALRSCCAYRTVSYVATNLIAALPPMDLLVQERMAVHDRRRLLDPVEETRSPREVTMDEWKKRLEVAEKGEWTRTLIKDVKSWCARSHGLLSFHLVQVLSGHGCFGSYLVRIGKEENARCHHCEAARDDPEHTLFSCPAWDRGRNMVRAAIGSFEPGTVIEKMLEGPEYWMAVEIFATGVMRDKEAAERTRRALQ